MDSLSVHRYFVRMAEFLIKLAQVSVAAAVMFGAIYFEQSTNYHLNPNIVGAWSFMAAYGLTLLAVRLADRRVRLGRIIPRFGRKQSANKRLDV